jgi:RNA polymerase sigma-70 factor (ECF subfamily)
MLSVKSTTFDEEGIGRVTGSATLTAEIDNDQAVFIEKLRSGDEAAFETLVDRYSGGIYAMLYRLTEDVEEARDLTQDTFLKAIRAVRSFRGDSELKTWLYRIAINESRNRFRWWKRRRRDLTISLDAQVGDTDIPFSSLIRGNSQSPEDSALANEREYALQGALTELKPIYREAVILCDIEGLSYEETAEALGCGIGTVKSRISRGREELRRRLKDI